MNGSNFGKKIISRKLKSLKFIKYGCQILTPCDGELNYDHVGRNVSQIRLKMSTLCSFA
ncbi:hypothetical protein HanIR_Chr17g0849431 [Helianthus annuus]|nr:hypothetical protein HanIR_Chr17g0849431 [Helianthus annuus]